MTIRANRRAVQLRAARRSDLEAVQSLLRANALPIEGVREALTDFVVAEDDGRVVGVVGVEQCGAEFGLLRSAAVDERVRGLGVGRALVERAIADARSRGVRALYLLTTTAEDYFPAFGFERIERDRVPVDVRATSEFTTACPASATVMTLAIASGDRVSRE